MGLFKDGDYLHDALFYSRAGLRLCIPKAIETAIMYLGYAQYLQYCGLSTTFYNAVGLNSAHIPLSHRDCQEQEWWYSLEAIDIAHDFHDSTHVMRAFITLGYSGYESNNKTAFHYFNEVEKIMHKSKNFVFKIDVYFGLALTDKQDSCSYS